MTEEARPPEEKKTPEQLIAEMEAAEEPISRDDVRDSFEDTPGSDKNSNVVPIVAIIAGAVILIACLFACAAVAAVFLANPPW